MRRAARHDRRERGLVLVYVSVLGVLMALMWLLAWRGTQDAIRVERAYVRRELRDVTVIRAGAVGLSLLETGLPPSDPYTCIVTIDDDGTLYDCTVQFTGVTGWHTWDVDVREATPSEVATLPAAPATF